MEKNFVAVNKWNWPKFNEELNTIRDETTLPPTDSRLRGDRRALEQGNLELAGKEKVRLEEKQRAERRERETKKQPYIPKYFKEEEDLVFGHKFVSVGKYWEERGQTVNNTKHQEDGKSEESKAD